MEKGPRKRPRGNRKTRILSRGPQKRVQVRGHVTTEDLNIGVRGFRKSIRLLVVRLRKNL